MSRVLVTDGTSALGAALVRRLLRDPAYDVRVADERPAPQWMREGCEIHAGGLRDPEQARRAVEGCPLVVQLATAAGPFTALETTVALVRAALDAGVERLVHVSAAADGEAVVRAAGVEHGLPFTLCRVAGERGAPLPDDRLADAIVAALASPDALGGAVELGGDAKSSIV
jgi:UDP-glucose 4-epimerase